MRERYIGWRPIRAVRRPRGAFSGQEILIERRLRDTTDRELHHRATQVTTGITVLQPSHEDRGERSAGDHTELSRHRHRTCQRPVGDGDAHAVLDDLRK